MLYETKFLLSLILTCIVEILVLFIFIKLIFKIKKIKNLKIIFVGIVASTLTLPYLWFISPSYINAKYYLQIGELSVILIESIIYNQLLEIDIKKSIFISFAANIISFIIGLVVF